MTWPDDPLQIEPNSSIQEIIDFIQQTSKKMGREKAILGLS
jgi:NH3-dependent NAD+ synthetase